VDPTCTGLNEILAKGTNMLPKIPEVLICFHVQPITSEAAFPPAFPVPLQSQPVS
jgi:hypothetical protein